MPDVFHVGHIVSCCLSGPDVCATLLASRGKKGFLQQIAADLAVALKVDKTRLEVVDCVPSSDLDRTVVEVRVLPEKDGCRPPRRARAWLLSEDAHTSLTFNFACA
eukprot:550723-Rhodomonas_salina.1